MKNKKLSIAFITNNYKPYSGGVVKSIITFKKELESLGHKVFIITLDFNSKSQSAEENVIRINCPIKFIYKQNPMAIPFLSRYSIYKLINKIKPDIIHSHHPFLLGKSALVASKKLNIPIVFTHHTLYDKYTHYIPISPKISIPTINHKVLSYCSKVDGIIAPSKTVRNILKRQKISTPIKIISSGIRKSFYLNKFSYKEKNKNKPFTLLSVSRFAKEKNIQFLLDTFSNMDLEKYCMILVQQIINK